MTAQICSFEYSVKLFLLGMRKEGQDEEMAEEMKEGNGGET
jgi:hypothetical protein